MDDFDFWRLCDELTVFQAALLVAGCDPSTATGYCENWNLEDRPRGYEPAKHALSHGLISGKIKGRLVPIFEHDINGNTCGEIPDTVDIKASAVEVDSLRQWLRTRGVKTGFFFPLASNDSPDYLEPTHPRYAPKLAAAVQAWLAVDDPKGKHPKQALTKWLREHGAEFGLSDDEGKPNEQGIEECAKVANWQPGGGAPKTPGG